MTQPEKPDWMSDEHRGPDLQTWIRLGTIQGKTAEQVIQDLKQLNHLEHNPTKSSVYVMRKTMLMEAGYDPNDWTWWTNDRGPDVTKGAVYTPEDIAALTKPFPPGLQALILPGHLIGGSSWDADGFSMVESSFLATGFTIFVRRVEVGARVAIGPCVADSP